MPVNNPGGGGAAVPPTDEADRPQDTALTWRWNSLDFASEVTDGATLANDYIDITSSTWTNNTDDWSYETPNPPSSGFFAHRLFFELDVPANASGLAVRLVYELHDKPDGVNSYLEVYQGNSVPVPSMLVTKNSTVFANGEFFVQSGLRTFELRLNKASGDTATWARLWEIQVTYDFPIIEDGGEWVQVPYSEVTHDHSDLYYPTTYIDALEDRIEALENP